MAKIKLFICVFVTYLGTTWAEENELAILRKELLEMKTLFKQTQESQNEKIRRLEEEIKSLKDNKPKRLLDQQSVISQLELDMQTLNGKVTAIQQNLVQDGTPKRGFTANLKNDLSNLGDNQIIIFDNVVTNIGNNYNPVTGVFTCEIPGMYVFFVNTLAEPGKHAETILFRNTQSLALTYAYDKEFFSSGSNMAVVDLQKGDTVLVKSNGHEHDSTGSILDYLYTSFTGFLVTAG